MSQKDESKVIHDMLKPLGEILANQMAEELEVKKGLLQPKNSYIQQKSEEIIATVQKEIEERKLQVEKASLVLQDALFSVEKHKKEKIEAELQKAAPLISSILDNKEVEIGDSLQEFLGLSNETLLWIYDVGYECTQNDRHEDALGIFLLLTNLNALVADYWVALGITQRYLNQEVPALYSFSIASLLNPAQPLARYHSADIYLGQQQPNDAKAEVAVLEHIIQSQNRTDLQPALEDLKHKLELAKAS